MSTENMVWFVSPGYRLIAHSKPVLHYTTLRMLSQPHCSSVYVHVCIQLRANRVFKNKLYILQTSSLKATICDS